MRCYHCMKEITGQPAYCPYCGQNPAEQNAVHRLPCGTVLNNRYVVGATIGEGGFGITYVGYDQTLHSKVAVKEYFPSGIATRNHTISNTITLNISRQTEYYQKGQERFLQEARNIALFSDEEGVVNVRDCFEENGTAYIIMEYLNGVDLSKYLVKYGVQDVRQTFETLLPLMRTLQKMHQKGIIHRDISPDNIMRLNDGRLKLMDFGSARFFMNDETKTMSVLLKQGYSPIEQYSSKSSQGPWTDVYSLCATIYKCIVGKTPSNALERHIEDDVLPPSALGVPIPPALESALMQGLAVHPADRIRDMQPLIQAVEAYQDDEAWQPDALARSLHANQTVPAADVVDKTVMADKTSFKDDKTSSDTASDKEGATAAKPKRAFIRPLVLISIAVLLVGGIIAGLVMLRQPDDAPAKEETQPAVTEQATAETETETETPSVTTGAVSDADLFGNEDNITLKVWVPDKALTLTQQQVKRFQAEHPDKTMSISVEPQGENDAASLIMSNPENAPDLLLSSVSLLEKLESAKMLAYPGAVFQDAITARDSETAVDAITLNGQMEAFPVSGGTTFYLVYDSSVVSAQQAGKLEDVLAACKKAGKQFIMNCEDGYYSSLFAFTAGVIPNGYEADGMTQSFTNYNEDEAVAILQAFSRLMHNYTGTFVSGDPAEISTKFESGKLGAGFDGTWNAAENKKVLGERYGAAKLPTINVNGTDKQLRLFTDYRFFGVNSISAFPRSAQALANYLADEVCQQERAVQLEWMPTNRNIQSSATVTENPLLSALVKQDAQSVPQKEITAFFWSAMANLGNNLNATSTNPEDATFFRSLLNQTIQQVRDE